MVRVGSLSTETGCEVLAKCEFLNPGGTSKDRIAKNIVLEAERDGLLKPGGTIVEGTSGSTGISLAQVACARGYKCVIVLPDDQALEKRALLTGLGARVELVRPAAIVNSEHYVNKARRLAAETAGAFFANQFENLANYRAHLLNTGPEIWEQTQGQVDAFVMSAGTGGTIAGVGRFLQAQNPAVRVVLADPQGSSLHSFVEHGTLYTKEQAERRVRRHRDDTITEGIGLDRLTANFCAAGRQCIGQAIRVSDQEVVKMSRRVLREDGLFVGSSSALNLVAARKVALQLGPGHTVVTVLCGSGSREQTKLYNDAYLRERGLDVSFDGSIS
ncbi:Cysteine synthase 2 (CS 2) (Cysteine synthase-like protein) (CSl) (O-acetylserine (thiol)-lyase 2) (OAS-TL 2) (O-acetylserine sulfhydrylase 2) [Durusdinium trenchii]|uniref:Cysteine synthase 2 (CS 2) (Cysteine synthase-like protein) (CSl) (O-acetylserine (Thiol)-lyase 2) (OAS-TL 2) (O-acetylserine sulfhydrylase 2) n=1 Tax=Durusdinium trenchii TaxID=1381693 RepID=A0ABP0L6S3_9DINO